MLRFSRERADQRHIAYCWPRERTQRREPEEHDAIISLSHDASTDSRAAIDRAAQPDLCSAPPEPLTVSLAAWETDGGRVFEPPTAPAGAADG